MKKNKRRKQKTKTKSRWDQYLGNYILLVFACFTFMICVNVASALHYINDTGVKFDTDVNMDDNYLYNVKVNVSEIQNTFYVDRNDGTDIQVKINDCPSTGCTVYIPTGTYQIATQIVINKSNVELIGLGNPLLNLSSGSEIIDSRSTAPTENGGMLLTTNVTPRMTSITVNSTTGFAVGDIIIIKSNFTKDGTYHKGELNKIQSITGTTINLTEPTIFTANIEDKGRVEKLTTYENNRIQGLRLNCNDEQGASTFGIRMGGFESLTITDVTIENCGSHGIEIVRTYGADIYNNQVFNSLNSGTGYGIKTNDGSRHIIMHHNWIEHNDEGFDCGSGEAWSGYPAQNEISNNYILGNVENCIDMHYMCSFYTVKDNYCYGSGGVGVQGDGLFPTIENNMIYDTTTYCVEVTSITPFGEAAWYGQNAKVLNNKCFNNRGNAVLVNANRSNVQVIGNQFYNQTTPTSHYTINIGASFNWSIIGNTFDRCTRTIITSNKNGVIEGNHIDNCQVQSLSYGGTGYNNMDRYWFTTKSTYTAGNSTATYFIGNGSQLTGIDETITDIWINSAGESTGALTTTLNIDANTLVVSESVNFVGIGDDTPSQKLHVKVAEGGEANANSNVDLIVENSENTGIQFISPTTTRQYIIFGNNVTGFPGYIYYNHPTDKFVIRVNNTDLFDINSSFWLNHDGNVKANFFHGDGSNLTGLTTSVTDVWINSSGESTGALSRALNIDSDTLVVEHSSNTVGIGIAAPDVKLHVKVAEDGGSNANSNVDIIAENNANTGIQFLSPRTTRQHIMFGDEDHGFPSYIYYDHPTNKLVIRVNNSDVFSINSSQGLYHNAVLRANHFHGNGGNLTGISIAAETDPHWSSNFTAYNSSWSASGTNTNCSADDSCPLIAYDHEINKTYVDDQDSAQDACSEITGCVENAITSYKNLSKSDIDDFGFVTSNQSCNTTSTPTFANINVGDHITHTGDTDTYIDFAGDTITLLTGGYQRFQFAGVSGSINTMSQDYNFQIKSNNSEYMFFVDAGEDGIGINSDSPKQTFDVNGTMNITETIYVRDNQKIFLGNNNDVYIQFNTTTGTGILG